MNYLLADVPDVVPIVWVSIIISAQTAAITFLVFWIRTLYQERREDTEKELAYRDEMLERVLLACGKLADAVAIVSSKGGA